MTIRLSRHRFVLLAGATFALAGPAHAQSSCAVPLQLVPNTAYPLDTCRGERQLATACHWNEPLPGPVAIVQFDLPYPAGAVSVQSTLDRTDLYLMRERCSGTAFCSVRSGSDVLGAAASIDFSTIDSGRYFLAIATWQGFAAGDDCGLVWATWNVSPEQETLLRNGVFRGGNAPVWEPQP